MTEPPALEQLLEQGLSGRLNPSGARRSLSRRLPEAIRDEVIRARWVDTRTRSNWSTALTDKLWPEVREERSGHWDHGWAELVAGLAVAIELAAGELPSAISAELSDSPAEAIWRTMRAEYQRFALLIDAEVHVRRVFACAAVRVPDVRIEDAIAWGHDGPEFRDRSHTLLLALMADGLLPFDLGPIAASGELKPGTDEVLPVLGLDRKAAGWWSRYPDGIFITGPVAQDKPGIWVGITRAQSANNQPRAAWLCGTTLPEIAAKLAALSVISAKLAAPPGLVLRLAPSPSTDEPTTGPLHDVLLDAAWASHQDATRDGQRRGLVIRGGAGAGKTTLAMSLAQRFVSGPLGALGFGVYVRACDLSAKLTGPRVPSWPDLLEGLVPLERARLETLAKSRRIVPIIDDWDQLPPSAQRVLREFLEAHESWWIATSRSPIDVELPPARGLELAPRIVEVFGTDELERLIHRALEDMRITYPEAGKLRRFARRALGDLALTRSNPIEDQTFRRIVTVADFTSSEIPDLELALERFGYLLTRKAGTWHFQQPAIQTFAAETARAARVAREATYRSSLADSCRSMPVFGLPNGRFQTTQDALFVAPALWPKEGAAMSLEELADELDTEDAPPWLVLGDPGAGKTTLTRYLARALSAPGRERLPIWLPLRKIADSKRTLWEDLSAPVVGSLAQAELDAALADGRIVLLLDGLDELEDPRRATLIDDLQGLRARAPRINVVLTCRLQSHRRDELEPARELRLDRLPQVLRDTLLQRWCALLHPGDQEASREQAYQAIRAGFEHLPIELSATPLFVAMFAVAWRADEALPTTRWEALDRCLRTMLFTWPRARHSRFGEIDEDRQLEAIERIAWRLQDDIDVARFDVPRRRLVALACEVFEAMELGAGRTELANAWIDHLVEGVGLLEEGEPGRLYFVHRALLESLAAGGLWRIYGADAARVIVGRRRVLERDIYRFLFDRRATDPDFADALLTAGLASLDACSGQEPSRDDEGEDESGSPRRGVEAELLMEAALAGASWSEEQYRQLFEGLARALRRVLDLDQLDRGRRYRTHYPSIWVEPWARLRRERPELADAWRKWLGTTLSKGSGDQLIGAITWCKSVATDIPCEPVLEARGDAPRAAGDCIDLWPMANVGSKISDPNAKGMKYIEDTGPRIRRWVARRVTADVALARVDRWPDADLFDLSCAAMYSRAGEPMLAALATRVAETALRLGSVSSEGANLIVDSARKPTRGEDDFIAMRRGDPAVMVYPRRPPLAALHPGTPGRSIRSFQELLTYLAEVGQTTSVHAPIASPPRSPPPRLPEVGPLTIDTDLLAWFTEHLDLEHTFGWFDIKMLSISLAGSINVSRPLPGSGPLVPVAVRVARGRGMTPPPTSTPRDSRFILARLRGTGDQALAYLPQLRGVCIGEHLVFACATPELEPKDRLGAFRHRMRSRLALELWPLVELCAQECGISHDRPALAALNLALGWSQHTTTGQWPETELWSGCFRGTPVHWLVRAHWHLAWLTHNPGDRAHLSGLDSALKVGRRDRDLAPIAARMSMWRRT